MDVDRPRAHILDHWNYAPGVKKGVYVVSSAASVELTLNGGSLGRREPRSRFLFTFHDVAWSPGCSAKPRTRPRACPRPLKLTAHTAPSA